MIHLKSVKTYLVSVGTILHIFVDQQILNIARYISKNRGWSAKIKLNKYVAIHWNEYQICIFTSLFNDIFAHKS